MSVKPLLYNGFRISDDLIIINRIEKIYFTDVYVLSNKKYLYLFLDLNPNDIVDKRGKYDIRRLNINSKSYVFVIVENHYKNYVLEILRDLTSAKGFECVAGMKELKDLLTADVINPLRNPEKFNKFKVSIPNGIILYGPPGCGKTFIVRKLAEELGYNFYDVKHSDLASTYIHGSVPNIAKKFKIAKENSPAVLFFDEISGLVPDRRNIHHPDSFKEEEVNEFLMQLQDAADNNILVVGATNYIERIDPAILRPGRFDKKIHVPVPDFDARISLFKIGLSNRPYDGQIDFEYFTILSDGFTCADIIEDVVESSARDAVNQDLSLIDQLLIESHIRRVILEKKSKKIL